MQANQNIDESSAFRHVARTGVIYVMGKAHLKGYRAGAKDWANLGQGAPETGSLPEAPDRMHTIPLPEETMEYGHVVGVPDFRAAVADLYNARYRKGMASQYTAENVAIAPGGRAALVRLACAMRHLNVGHLIPDYTAYAELLDAFRTMVPIPVLLNEMTGYRLRPESIRDSVSGMGLGALLMSNPNNPTGQVLHGPELRQLLDVMRDFKSSLLIDEFYSHYHYGVTAGQASISAASYVEDIEKEPTVIIDGLTKNWRYPGLRISWTLAPRSVIRTIASAGSFLDGGAAHAVQRAAIPLLDRSHADAEAHAIQSVFDQKRKYMLERLRKMNFKIPGEPQGSFYVFASLENLPESLRDGFDFFRTALTHKVICVPGVFFDVDPGKRREHIPSRFTKTVRLSYGAPMDELKRGLDALEAMIAGAD